jgi:hypothetical protein
MKYALHSVSRMFLMFSQVVLPIFLEYSSNTASHANWQRGREQAIFRHQGTVLLQQDANRKSHREFGKE